MNNEAKKYKVPRILILDDNSDLVDVCADTLHELYHVIKATSPFEALNLMLGSKGAIDLILSDYIMPGMNGIELIKRLRKEGIYTPAILYSGKKIEEQSDEFIKIMEKPFRMKELMEEAARAIHVIQQDRNFSGEFSGALKQLDTAIHSLEKFLMHKHKNFSSLTPEMALIALKSDSTYDVFVSWHSLKQMQLTMTRPSSDPSDPPVSLPT